ncbi:hypothetical protein F4827_006254 [Paraburkholderia bannensis]|uniref:Uncharacterized protein n=1 Tax=Paraburkholderia bannensis TaxID=765414 RepID=A0A7W9WW32_9BURK|nr:MULTISPECIES: glycosyltransferase family 9 protein [Paraburkholderia]MBB3261417.1 hypothetical protein [Paraburkholderia sp. WP4_3_2]MBB6106379.1 hypothetical protein [Paraburkholderia bannensis]
MELATLAPLLADPHSRFFSLQFGALTEAERAILARHDVVDAARSIRSFADLADIVMQLDLVITIDSAPAHLCGALDVPVWTLLARVHACTRARLALGRRRATHDAALSVDAPVPPEGIRRLANRGGRSVCGTRAH